MKRRCSLLPPPLWGRVGEGGSCLPRWTPTPTAFGGRPSPQGGG
ncbi:MAG: hypothetical protein OJF62_000608 [Pseudolabrys sp.]|nr:hypothetical protein [Pseudolabrys sp.]